MGPAWFDVGIPDVDMSKDNEVLGEGVLQENGGWVKPSPSDLMSNGFKSFSFKRPPWSWQQPITCTFSFFFFCTCVRSNDIPRTITDFYEFFNISRCSSFTRLGLIPCPENKQ